ncbi:MAG: hypothetical protein R3B81_01240 [bacterium]
MNEMNHDEESDVALPLPAAAEIEEKGPRVPKPHDRPADVDRKIRSAVDRMLQEVDNPYQTVIVAAQEARRINENRLKARSILNQSIDQVEELVPDMPFVPRPVEDDEPEVKPTNEALERLALGIVEFEISGSRKEAPSYYEGEIDFPLYPEGEEESSSS